MSTAVSMEYNAARRKQGLKKKQVLECSLSKFHEKKESATPDDAKATKRMVVRQQMIKLPPKDMPILKMDSRERQVFRRCDFTCKGNVTRV